jgi:hypothetical protein
MVTRCALTDCKSTVKVFIPTSNKRLLILNHELLNLINFAPAKTTASMQSHRRQPELRDILLALNMHMGRLIPIA